MSQFQITLSKLNVPIPEPITKATAVRIGVGEFVAVPPAAELDLGSAIVAGELSPDEAIARIRATSIARLERAAMTGVVREMSRDFDRANRKAIAESGGEVIAALKPITADAITKLAGAITVIGPCPDSRSTSNGGPLQLEAFAEFKQSVAQLQHIGTIIGELHEAKFLPCPPADVVAWLAPGSDVARARQVLRSGDGNRQALLLGAGFQFQVNDADEQAALVAAATDASMSATPRVATVDPKSQRNADAWGRLVRGNVPAA